MKTTVMAKAADVERKWYVVDAENQTVGRLAAEIAKVLRGKNKPIYTPHVDTGDYVIVINAEKVKFTGKKLTDKTYFVIPVIRAARPLRLPVRCSSASRPVSLNTL